jgi:8-oxo-dGTP pyrophosphatase MutT (NUDIX family)
MQPGMVRQAGVVAVRNGHVCLVTSRSGKRWVVPKGGLEAGKSAGEIALQEAWEEAGLVGLLQEVPLGSYVYEKDGALCHVIVFRLQVTAAEESYPEAGLRQRVWLPVGQALARLDDAGLREILRESTGPRSPEARG